MVVSPGFVQTEIFDSGGDPEPAARYRDVMRETGLEPDVVAASIVGLAAQPAGVNTLELAIGPT